MSVEVKLELGHRACLRDKPTAEGFTHDWTVFVKGPGAGADANSIQHFVDKVVFHLHESFPKPKRVIKEPPYSVSESGYASFIMPIEVCFRSKEEPKKVCFEYDLYLRLDGPPVSNIRYEKLTFQNPTEDFRRKLIKAGGLTLGTGGPANPPALQPPALTEHVEELRPPSGVKTHGGTGEKKRHHSATKESAKPAPPPPPPPLLPPLPLAPSQPFNDMFGTPVNKPNKHSSGSASKTKEPGHLGPKSGKTLPSATTSTSSASKETKSTKESNSGELKESKPTKSSKQEKEIKPTKRVSPVQGHSDPPPPEKRRRTSTSHELSSEKSDVKSKNKEVKDKEKYKKPSASVSVKKERDKKNKSLTPPPKNKEPTKSPKLSVPHQKLDKHPSPLIESSSQEAHNNSETSSRSNKLERVVSPVPPSITENNKVSRPLSALYAEGDDSLLSPLSSDEESVPHSVKGKEAKEGSDSENVHSAKIKSVTKASSTPSDKKSLKQKSAEKSKVRSKPTHSEDHDVKDSQHQNQNSNIGEKEVKQKKTIDPSNISELIALQKKIMSLEDRSVLQRIVDVIEKTGRFHMTSSSFDFDLCSLDHSTLKKLSYLLIN